MGELPHQVHSHRKNDEPPPTVQDSIEGSEGEDDHAKSEMVQEIASGYKISAPWHKLRSVTLHCKSNSKFTCRMISNPEESYYIYFAPLFLKY